MSDFNDVLAMVTQHPIPERPSDPPYCPLCAADLPRRRPDRTTLVGGGDGTWDGDVNHTWTEYTCRECGWEGTRETKSGNVWYTDRYGEVTRGMPSCFESYVYTCRRCGEAVTRDYFCLDRITKAISLGTYYSADGTWGKHYCTRYRCEQCGTEAWPPIDYFNGS